ncbi:MAG TPA: hypothetical protein VGM93_12130 [Acidimicrobiales bacterium]
MRLQVAPGLHLTPAQQTIVHAYRDAAEAYARDASHPEGGGADLARYWMGEALAQQRAGLADLRRGQRVVRAVPSQRSGFAVERAVVTQTTGVLVLCFHDAGVSVDRISGRIAGGLLPDQEFVVGLRRSAARWLIAKGARYTDRPRPKAMPCLH